MKKNSNVLIKLIIVISFIVIIISSFQLFSIIKTEKLELTQFKPISAELDIDYINKVLSKY